MPPSDRNEALLEQVTVLRAQLGNRGALSRLAAAYDDRLLFYLRRLAGPNPDAEDIRQEVWLTVVRKLHTLEEPAAFRTWLYQIARRHAISFLRRNRREIPLDSLPLEDEPRAVHEEDVELGFTADDATAIYAALDGLKPAQREVLTLRYFGGLTYEELATVLDCPVGTARSRLHYAKAALRAAVSHTMLRGET